MSRRPPRRRAALVPTVALAVVGGLGLGACGDTGPAPIDGGPDASALREAFTAATGVPLVRADGDGETTLGPALTTAALSRFGGFTIHLVENADARKALLVDGVGEPLPRGRDGRWTVDEDLVVEDYGRGVLVAAAPVRPEQDPAGPALHRAVVAAIRRDPSLLPAAERPCPRSGASGTCVLDGVPVDVAGTDRTVASDDSEVTLSGVAVADELPLRADRRDEDRIDGRFVLVRYRYAKARDLTSTQRPTLRVGRSTYSVSPQTFPVPSDPYRTSARVRDATMIFALPAAAVAPALREGVLLLPPPDGAPQGPSRIALGDAPRLSLKEALRP